MSIKTSVYLPDELKRDLAQLAAESGDSEATLIRAAIGELLRQRRGTAPPTLPLFRSTGPGIAGRVDRLLAEHTG